MWPSEIKENGERRHGIIQIRLEVRKPKKKCDGGPEITVRIRLRLINCSVIKKKKGKKGEKRNTLGVTETQKLRLRCCPYTVKPQHSVASDYALLGVR